jgi:glycosyltransferase involved in cell wall biosynthesis
MSGYAFVQSGSFSGVNLRLSNELRAVISPHDAPVIDVRENRRLARGVVLNGPPQNIAATFHEFGQLALSSPRTFVNRRYATTVMFDHRSSVARTRLAGIDPDFVFQTQLLFDAHLPGRPFFVYTDHTALANKRYALPQADATWSAGWITREAAAYRAATHIFVSSEFARVSLLEDYGCEEGRVTTVGSGVNIAVPDELPVRDGPVRTILFAGHEWNRKGGPDLLAAFADLRSDFPQMRLIVAGAQPRISQPGVSVLGPVASGRLGELMLEADIFCMPSHVEPSACVYLEAAAYGLPVVATTVGGTPERVLHGATGYLCEPGDRAALRNQLRALAESRALCNALGAAGHSLIGSKSTWRGVAQTISALLPRG